MWNIFSDLKNLGFDKLSDQELYDSMEDGKKKGEEAQAAVEHLEEDYLFDKTYECPICNKKFISKTVRTRKAKLVDSDMDLKPNYDNFEPLKYDVIACDGCGYASLTRSFDHLAPVQKKLIREQVVPNFKGLHSRGLSVYSFEEAEERYKMALINAMAMKSKNSERAYICLKLGWLYRSERKRIAGDKNTSKELIAELTEKEQSCIKLAYEGFQISYSNESVPICGMDTTTISYLLADLARQCGDYKNAIRYVGFILTSRDVSERVKERARTEKDLIAKEMANA